MRALTFDCYGTVADWNTCMSGALAAIAGLGGPDAGRLLTAYHQAELEIEAGPGWRPYREVLAAGLAQAAGREHIPLPRGDEEFRLAVDRALSHIYRGGEIGTLFKRTFGDANPGQVLGTLYLITGLPD